LNGPPAAALALFALSMQANGAFFDANAAHKIMLPEVRADWLKMGMK